MRGGSRQRVAHRHTGVCSGSTKTRQMLDVSASKEEEEWTNGKRGQGMKGEHTTFGHGGRNVHSGGAPLSFKMANWVRGNKTGGG